MSLGSHQSTIGKSQVHLTPRWLLDRLGEFDLDPCAATVRPWDCARVNYTECVDGLALPWNGRVWLNPPFDRRVVGKWIQRLADHGDGIALVHARTEAAWFEPIWKKARLILFLAERITFRKPDGSPTTKRCGKTGRDIKSDSGAPAVLAAFGQGAADMLSMSDLPGAYVTGWAFTPTDIRETAFEAFARHYETPTPALLSGAVGRRAAADLGGPANPVLSLHDEAE